jgi:hypothetical protein
MSVVQDLTHEIIPSQKYLMDIGSAIFLKKRVGFGTHSDTKFGRRRAVFYRCQEKQLRNAVPVCARLSKLTERLSGDCVELGTFRMLRLVRFC